MHLEAVANAHAAAFIGRTPWDVSRDAALLADAHQTAWSCYAPRTVVPVIEPLLAEAEAWGAQVYPRDGGEGIALGRPVVPDFRALDELPEIDPENPALSTLLAAARALPREPRRTVAVPVTGPLATALALAGRDNLSGRLAIDPQAVRETMLGLVEAMHPWIEAIGRSGCAVAIHEADYAPGQFLPDVYASTFLPALRELVRIARRLTHEAPMLVVAGDTAPIAGHLCGSGAGYVACPDTTQRTAFLAQARCHPDVTVRIDLPRELWTNADWPAICRAIAEAAGAARLHARTVLGTGPLPLRASSVMVVDASHFAMNMDPWLDPY
jgi:uroporphyrinogen-III decarboxylase